ncbi:hypothetical protein BGZ70_004727, partial [Mortierella alpina]
MHSSEKSRKMMAAHTHSSCFYDLSRCVRKRDGSETAPPAHPFGFNYGTEAIDLVDRELKALEEENILDYLDEVSTRDRAILDSMGAEFYIKDYYWLLRHAKADEDARVDQLKMTAV